MGIRGGRARIVRRWLPIAVACLAVSLLPVSAVGAAEEPAGADEPASDALAAAETVPDDSAGGVEVVRYAGADRYELSLAVAQALVDTDGGASEWVVLASGESWADAATAGPLAASLGAPVVLVPPGGLQTATARPDLVEFLRSSGVRRVVIVGSSDVLPNHEPSVLFGLGMLPRNIERVHGDDPVGTSIAVAERLGAPAEFGELGGTVLIASDQSVADAVAVGPLAAAGPFPLLLTAPGALDPRIAAYLTEHEVAHAVLVGGTAAIAPAVEEALETAGTAVTRLAGRDRSETARLAAELTEQHTADDPACADGPIRLGLVPAQQPEQALTAGPLLAQACTPLRYTEPSQLPADLRNALYLASHSPEGAHVAAFGDEAQIPDDLLEPALPPALLAFSCDWPQGHPRHGEFSVAIVDEHGDWRYYPLDGPSFLIDPTGPLNPEADRCWVGGGHVFEWSPDGRYLAEVGLSQVLIVDVVGDEVVEAKIDAPEAQFSSSHRPVWSPDSTKLAFSAFPGDASTLASRYTGSDHGLSIFPTAEMYVYDTRTGETTRLTHNATSDAPYAWSPDSGSIAFTQAEIDIGIFSIVWYSTSLRVLELGTGSVNELYERANSHPDVHWAPDGSHLAFTGYGDPSERSESEHPEWYRETRVFLAISDGSAVEELTSDGRWGRIWRWTADSSEIHYVSYSPFERLVYGQAPESEQVRVWNVKASEDRVLTDLERAAAEELGRARFDSRPQATIIENDRLVIRIDAKAQDRVIIDFADRSVDKRNPCAVTWTDSGVRGSCEWHRDF